MQYLYPVTARLSGIDIGKMVTRWITPSANQIKALEAVVPVAITGINAFSGIEQAKYLAQASAGGNMSFPTGLTEWPAGQDFYNMFGNAANAAANIASDDNTLLFIGLAAAAVGVVLLIVPPQK